MSTAKTYKAGQRKQEAARLQSDAANARARDALQSKRDAMIASVADTVAMDWFKRCVRSQQAMTLFWRKPRTGENAACPIIDVSAPNEDFTAHCAISPAMSRDTVRAKVAQAMRELPMLSAEWFSV